MNATRDGLNHHGALRHVQARRTRVMYERARFVMMDMRMRCDTFETIYHVMAGMFSASKLFLLRGG